MCQSEIRTYKLEVKNCYMKKTPKKMYRLAEEVRRSQCSVSLHFL